ncbi:MAG: substrate-binding domain-containing protein [Polyangia bacterium]
MGGSQLLFTWPPFMARLALAAAVIAGVAGAAGACSRKAAPAPEARLRIGLVTKTETNPFFVKLREAAAERARQQGAELIALSGKFEGDNEGQVAAIENLIGKGVKGILVTPSNSSALVGAIKRARDKGILVTALDTPTEPPDAVDGTFATDNRQAGRLQGAWLKQALGGRAAKIVMLDGVPGGGTDTQRHQGFLAGFGIEENDQAIVGRAHVYGDQSKAHAAMENFLQAHPDVNVVYTINEQVARGAYAAIAARRATGAILIGSIDGACTGVSDVKAGKLGATVMQFPTRMAEQGIDAVVEYARTGRRPAGFIDTGVQLITDLPHPGLEARDTAFGLASCWG